MCQKEDDNMEEKKESIYREFRHRGMRLTKQRRLLVDIILKNECYCSKEIYYEAAKKDRTIGLATVYRMVKVLEEMGVITRKITYNDQFTGCDKGDEMDDCRYCCY